MALKTPKSSQSPMLAPLGIYQLLDGGQNKVLVTNVSTATTNPITSTTGEVVRVAVSTDCYVLFGDTPTVTTSNGHFLPAGTVEYFYVGPNMGAAFIRDTADGVATVSEVLREEDV